MHMYFVVIKDINYCILVRLTYPAMSLDHAYEIADNVSWQIEASCFVTAREL